MKTGKSLRICEYNVENLFISMDYHNGEDLSTLTEAQWTDLALAQYRRRQKPLFKIRGVAKAILDIDPDILMLVEVGGRESLENFNRYFLDDQFVPYFVPGNSRRSIDLGFLVKREFTDQVDVKSNRDIPIDVQAYLGGYRARFSRDVAELRLSDDRGLKMILFLVHLKSKISSDEDFRGTDVRTAEAAALAQLYTDRREEFPDVPILIGGDFNSPLSSPEFSALRSIDARDFHDFIDIPPEERVTLIYFDYYQVPHPETLDYILISPHLQNAIVDDQSYTYRYKGFYEIPHELPTERRERYQMPSDHFPVVLTFRIS